MKLSIVRVEVAMHVSRKYPLPIPRVVSCRGVFPKRSTELTFAPLLSKNSTCTKKEGRHVGFSFRMCTSKVIIEQKQQNHTPRQCFLPKRQDGGECGHHNLKRWHPRLPSTATSCTAKRHVILNSDENQVKFCNVWTRSKQLKIHACWNEKICRLSPWCRLMKQQLASSGWGYLFYCRAQYLG